MIRTTLVMSGLFVTLTTSAVAAEASPPATDVRASADASASAVSEAQPYTGWTRGKRAPMYALVMLTGGAFIEDGDNRLTTHDSKVLEGWGTVFRLGAVLNEHHRLGGRLQTFFRPTRDVMLDAGSTPSTTNEWGNVAAFFVGPEYIYNTSFGLYGAGSLGFGSALSFRDHHKDDAERASAGVGGVASLGYEWRTSKWFAMSAEVFAGLYHGFDDHEASMNSATFGAGIGAGF